LKIQFESKESLISWYQKIMKLMSFIVINSVYKGTIVINSTLKVPFNALVQGDATDEQIKTLGQKVDNRCLTISFVAHQWM
jgi:hypothetical protein